MRFGGFGFSRQFGFGQRASETIVLPALGNSVGFTPLSSGGNPTSTVTDNGDGRFLIAREPSAIGTVSFAVSSASIAGDFVIEIDPIAGEAITGADDTAEVVGGNYGNWWFSANDDNATGVYLYYPGSTFVAPALARGMRTYWERVGDVVRAYTGSSWQTRGVPKRTLTGQSTADAFCNIQLYAAGSQCRVRFCARPT